MFLHQGTRHRRWKQRPAYVIQTCSRRARGIAAFSVARGAGEAARGICGLPVASQVAASSFSQTWDHHETQHCGKEDKGMQEEARGRGSAHGVRDLEESTKERLRELVGFRVCNKEEDEGRYEGVLGLQQQI